MILERLRKIVGAKTDDEVRDEVMKEYPTRRALKEIDRVDRVLEEMKKMEGKLNGA